MDKELTNLLDNYENVIYGKAFPINPSIHQLHLLLDYIANLEQQCQEQKEGINKAREKLKKGLHELDTRRREEVYIEQYIEEALNILKEVE